MFFLGHFVFDQSSLGFQPSFATFSHNPNRKHTMGKINFNMLKYLVFKTQKDTQVCKLFCG